MQNTTWNRLVNIHKVQAAGRYLSVTTLDLWQSQIDGAFQQPLFMISSNQEEWFRFKA